MPLYVSFVFNLCIFQKWKRDKIIVKGKKDKTLLVFGLLSYLLMMIKTKNSIWILTLIHVLWYALEFGKLFQYLSRECPFFMLKQTDCPSMEFLGRIILIWQLFFFYLCTCVIYWWCEIDKVYIYMYYTELGMSKKDFAF